MSVCLQRHQFAYNEDTVRVERELDVVRSQYKRQWSTAHDPEGLFFDKQNGEKNGGESQRRSLGREVMLHRMARVTW